MVKRHTPPPAVTRRPAMLLRRKLWVVLGIAIVLLLMLASHSIQRRHILPLSQPSRQAAPTDAAAAEAVTSALPDVKEPLAPKVAPSEMQVEEGEDEEEENEEEEEEETQQSSEGPRLCGCHDSCVSDLKGSDWFSSRYDLKQQPILQAVNDFDPSALQWWLGLQRSGTDQTLEDMMSKMFQVISPPSVDTRPATNLCRKCAVVGNSGNLRSSGRGKLIDAHQFVIRMNKAITRGFEEDVGTRTTYHFMYPESAVDVAPGVSLVLLPFKLRDLEWLTSALSTGHIKTTYMRVKDRVEADKDKVLVVNPEFFKYVHDHWTEHHGRYPSTGMLALVFALHICDQVSVFGYGADQQGNWHHYWEENRNAGAFRKTGVHSADFETEVIQKLAGEGKIKLYV